MPSRPHALTPSHPPTIHRVFNFSAGPAILPEPVLKRVREELPAHGDTGTSVMEMSHRSAAYGEIHERALADVRDLLAIPPDFEVLFLQGGATLQFSMVPMNLSIQGRGADYVLTGSWSKKALAEARKLGPARVAASTEDADGVFRRIPAPSELDLDPEASYLHLTTNNTIFGTQWRELPETGVPLVADMSSDVLSRPVDWRRFGLAYAGAQKNLGPAGVTLIVLRKDLLARAPEDLPTMLDYRPHVAKGSRYNTPPTWSIYVTGLALAWVREQGGVEAMARRAEAKAALLYDRIDGSDFYRGTAEPDSRSLMNVTFRLPSEELERRFLAEAERRDLVGLKGHRSVGGLRASLYNAMPIEGVERLAELMEELERRA